MSVEFTSNLGAFVGASDRGLRDGLIAAADAYTSAVQGNLSGAYPGGTEAAATTHRGEPRVEPDGVTVGVGNTMGASGIGGYQGQPEPRPGLLTWPGGREFPLALAWEIGHHDPFLGQHDPVGGQWVPGIGPNGRGYLFVRKEVWVPTMVAMREQLVETVRRTAEAVVNSAGLSGTTGGGGTVTRFEGTGVAR